MSVFFEGVKHFTNKQFQNYKSLFKRLEKEQKPHTLFITCSDSRIDPNLITSSKPGDLFIIRNIANVVPNYRLSSEFLATTSAIEYAVLVLNVENIIICGHTNCGGCKSLFFNEEELNKIPHTKKWLELIKNAKIRAEKNISSYKDKVEIEFLVEQENIIEQMNHLLTYPFIEERYDNGTLNIYGFYYEINTGIVYNYNKKIKIFEEIK